MVFLPLTNQFEDNIEELILVRDDLSQAEHKTILRSLKTFMNSLVAPMGIVTDKAIRTLKRQREITENLISSLNSFSNEIAVTTSELSILRRALKRFASLPKPMYESLTNIRKMKHYQNTALSLLEEIVEE